MNLSKAIINCLTIIRDFEWQAVSHRDNSTFRVQLFYIISSLYLQKELKDDEESPNLVINWIVESKSSSGEFEDYTQALSAFKNISKEGKHVILYEAKKNPLDGSTVKKIPLLNSKKIRSTSPFKKSQNKSEHDVHPKKRGSFKDLKVRIFLLIVVLFCFLIIIYFINILTTNPSDFSSNSIHNFLIFSVDHLLVSGGLTLR
jgi:hypothetical protein